MSKGVWSASLRQETSAILAVARGNLYLVAMDSSPDYKKVFCDGSLASSVCVCMIEGKLAIEH